MGRSGEQGGITIADDMAYSGRMCHPPGAEVLPASGAAIDAKAEEGEGDLCLRAMTLAGERHPRQQEQQLAAGISPLLVTPQPTTF